MRGTVHCPACSAATPRHRAGHAGSQGDRDEARSSGAAGAGQLVKACNQLVIAMTLTGISEAVALRLKTGVDPYAMRDALLGGSTQSFVLQNHCKRLLDGSLAPGLWSSLLPKDLKTTLEA